MTALSPGRAFSYIRFSSGEQAKGDSLRRQIDLSTSFAAKHSLTLDESLTFRDLGVSAFTGSNVSDEGQLKAFLNAVDLGLVPPGSYLLVESLDRLSRAHIHDALALLMQILGKGIIVVTLGDEAVYRGKSGDLSRDLTSLLVSIVILARAHEESLTKSKRVGAAWSNKRKNAHLQKLTAQCPAWMELAADRSEYLLLDDKVAVVRQIIEMVQSGLGKGAVAKRLNEAGVPSIAAGVRRHRDASATSDRGWYSSYVTKIIKSRALIGEYQPHRMVEGKRVPAGEPIADYFPRVVSDEEFALLQHLINERGQRTGGRRGKAFSNLFTGLAKCGYCGAPMVFVDKGEDRRRTSSISNKFLVCHRAKRGDGCHYVSWNYQDLEEGFFRFVELAEFESFVRTTDEAVETRRSLNEREVVAMHRVAQLRERVERLTEAIATGAEGLPSVIATLASTQQALDATEAELHACQSDLRQLANQESSAETSAKALREVGASLQTIDGDERFRLRARINAHLRTTLDKLILFPGGWMHSSAELDPIRAEMNASGKHPPAVVDALIEEVLSSEPRKHDRFVVVRNRWNAERFYRFDIPTYNVTADADYEHLYTYASKRRVEIIRKALDSRRQARSLQIPSAAD